ncbi:unnamed protein product, partial [Rotaria magnacalcarata]
MHEHRRRGDDDDDDDGDDNRLDKCVRATAIKFSTVKEIGLIFK